MTATNLPQRGLLVAVITTLACVVCGASCNTYTVTGPSGANHTFNNYAFYDFRYLNDQISGTPLYSQDENFPNGQFALSTSPYFNSTPWTNDWSTTANLTVANHTLSQYTNDVFTPLNVAIVKDNSTNADSVTVLQLSTVRLNSYSASAQINTNQLFMHASVRLSARVLGAKGACAGIYYYGNNDNESDIEILTNDSDTQFHATNHPSQNAGGEAIAGATTIAPMPKNGSANDTILGSWNDWNDYRMDWLSDRTQWIINGDLVVDNSYHPPGIPSFLGINMWSNGGTWTGNMTVGTEAILQIRWVEIIYNTTGETTSESAGCKVQSNSNVSSNPGTVNSAPCVLSSLVAWLLVLGALLNALW